jgi:hypothetical protein
VCWVWSAGTTWLLLLLLLLLLHVHVLHGCV